ncbi:MAG: ROK family glucokinase [Propionibacteriales bacterium]|nr:ROK family glucokinase [Propionibacteriales bacterium]
MTVTIGIDIGGTKIAAGAVTADGIILEEQRVETPARDTSATLAAIVRLVTELASRHAATAVGIGAAGFVSSDRSTVMFAPNLAWRDEPLGSLVKSQVQMPVVVENDVNAAGWGEFRFGAGADVDDLLMVAVGTGIGGGVVIAGKLLRGSFGVAAEIGHLRVVPHGLPCGCGRRGCWEQYGSGRALVREARSRVRASDQLLEAAGGDSANITGQLITKQAQAGDALCVALLTDLGHSLGEGIASLAAVLDPGVVVIGGGVSEAGDLLLAPIQRSFDDHLPAADNRPHLELRLATLGNEAGMIGAADLARRDQ